MNQPTRDDLEAKWLKLWEWGQELKDRQRVLLESSSTMEEGIFDRAISQIEKEREQRGRELEDLKRLMEEHGGFTK